MTYTLSFANISVPVPIIQGGMGVRISMAELAAAVANEGGIGTIAGTGLTPEEVVEEIRKARKLTDGVIGINVLFAASQFSELVQAAMKEGIDLVISGAGFSRDMFKWGKQYHTPIVPVVSSDKFAVLAEKFGAAAVVVEGKEAAGHLGTDRPLFDILPEVLHAVNIPVIAAGGISNGEEIMKALQMGASGVQMGTIFAASEESNASDDMKRMYVQAKKEDVSLIESPVGFPSRGLKNNFFHHLQAGTQPKVKKCYACLKKCSHKYCILERLKDATADRNNTPDALMFCGEKVYTIKEILPVKKIIQRLIHEMHELPSHV